jgi:hypothetical protein
MNVRKTHAAALALAGALAFTAVTPSFAHSHLGDDNADAIPMQSTATQGFASQSYASQPARHVVAQRHSALVNGEFAPGSTGYGRRAYNPEQPTDPDPRIGGGLKMSTDR